jgi:hypothetical protein
MSSKGRNCYQKSPLQTIKLALTTLPPLSSSTAIKTILFLFVLPV